MNQNSRNNDGLAFYNAGQWFESDCVGNNSIIKNTHGICHEPRDEIFQAPSPFFGGGVWVRGYARLGLVNLTT